MSKFKDRFMREYAPAIALAVVALLARLLKLNRGS